LEVPRSATVVGAGSMGTAIGYLLASSGVEVVFWSRSRDVVESINRGRVNARYLPRLRLPEGVSATTDLEEAVSRGELVVLALPSRVVGGVVARVSSLLSGRRLLSVVKGLVGGELLSAAVRRLVPGLEAGSYAALTGPNFAVEIGFHHTYSLVASADQGYAAVLARVLSVEKFHAMPWDDVGGVEASGVLKNIVAVAIGIVDGLDMGDNTKSYLFSHAYHEILDIGERFFGARRETLLHPACLGDVVATSFSNKSRNRLIGLLLSKNVIPRGGREGFLVEGLRNIRAVYNLIPEAERGKYPVLEFLYRTVHGGANIYTALEELLSRI